MILLFRVLIYCFTVYFNFTVCVCVSSSHGRFRTECENFEAIADEHRSLLEKERLRAKYCRGAPL